MGFSVRRDTVWSAAVGRTPQGNVSEWGEAERSNSERHRRGAEDRQSSTGKWDRGSRIGGGQRGEPNVESRIREDEAGE